jgi:hypothetical protein
MLEKSNVYSYLGARSSPYHAHFKGFPVPSIQIFRVWCRSVVAITLPLRITARLSD